MLEQNIKKVLVSYDEIVTAAQKLGAQLTGDMQGKILFLLEFLRVLFHLWQN